MIFLYVNKNVAVFLLAGEQQPFMNNYRKEISIYAWKKNSTNPVL